MSRDTKPMKKRGVVWFGIGILISTTAIIPASNPIPEPGERVQRVADARSVITACVAFSKDRDKFPPNLEALFPNYIDDESLRNWGTPLPLSA